MASLFRSTPTRHRHLVGGRRAPPVGAHPRRAPPLPGPGGARAAPGRRLRGSRRAVTAVRRRMLWPPRQVAAQPRCHPPLTCSRSPPRGVGTRERASPVGRAARPPGAPSALPIEPPGSIWTFDPTEAILLPPLSRPLRGLGGSEVPVFCPGSRPRGFVVREPAFPRHAHTTHSSVQPTSEPSMNTSWRNQAACQGLDPTVFYPSPDDDRRPSLRRRSVRRARCARRASSTPCPCGRRTACGVAAPTRAPPHHPPAPRTA